MYSVDYVGGQSKEFGEYDDALSFTETLNSDGEGWIMWYESENGRLNCVAARYHNPLNGTWIEEQY